MCRPVASTKKMRREISAIVAFFFALIALTGRARADEPPPTASTGVAGDRFAPGVGPVTALGVEGAATTPFRRVSVVLGLSYITDPLRIENRFTGELISRPVREQLTTDVSAEFGIWKRLAFAVGAPLVVYADGDRLRGTSEDA